MNTTEEGFRKKMKRAAASQDGFVLILALVTMLAMTLIGISLVMNMSTDMQLARNERESKQAFQLAEAGINEAISRMRLATANARYVGEPAGLTGYRTVAAWPAGSAFDFTTSADGLDYSVTVNYLTERDVYCDDNVGDTNVNGIPAGALNCNDEVVMFGQDFNICFNNIAACTKPSARRGVYPVYRITSVGTTNTTTRTVEVFVGASNLYIDTEGAINTNDCVNTNGGPVIAGGVQEGGACGACDAGIDGCNAKAQDNLNTFLSDPLADLASTADHQIDCNAIAVCNADIGDVPDAMWGTCSPGNPEGGISKLIYIKITGGASPAISGNDLGADNCGKGILIVDGDIELNGGFSWEGLVYVTGTLTLNGGGGAVNITGGAMAGNAVTTNGGLFASYDFATLQAVGRQAGSAAKTYISWKRL